jgi:hypothetical protein
MLPQVTVASPAGKVGELTKQAGSQGLTRRSQTLRGLDGTRNRNLCPSLAELEQLMRKALLVLAAAITAGCSAGRDDARPPLASALAIATSSIATVTVIGADTLSDSARIYYLQPEPDGGSVAFLFADPAKGVTRGLGIVQTSGGQPPQLVWPDSVTVVWWSRPHQLTFAAGTGQGVRLVVDVHAAQLEALEVTGTQSSQVPGSSVSTQASTGALSRAQAFIDSIRVQPEGTPQGSALRYQADSAIVGPGDTLAAIHVSARDIQDTKVNPAWYLAHLPSRHIQAVDSLIGRSSGLPASAGRWGADGSFYYAKERSIWQVRPNAQ